MANEKIIRHHIAYSIIDSEEGCFIADCESYWQDRETMIGFAQKIMETALKEGTEEKIMAQNETLNEYYEYFRSARAKLKKIEREKTPAYVYVMECASVYKIGVSKHPEYRRKELNERPYPLRIVLKSRLTENAYNIEKDLHEFFDCKRVEGEWFTLDKNDLEYIINYFMAIGVEDPMYSTNN